MDESSFKKKIVLTCVFGALLVLGVVLAVIDEINTPNQDMSTMGIIGTILMLGAGVAFMIQVNFWLDYLSFRFGFVYWPIIVALSVAALILGFIFVPILPDEATGQTLNLNGREGVIFLHGLIAFLGVPMLEGHMSHYMVVEDRYVNESYVDTNTYYADFYVAGWWKKLIVVGVFAGLYYGIGIVEGVHPWLVIVYGVIEIGFFGYLTVIALLKRRN